MAAASERRLNELAGRASASAPGQAAPATAGRRGSHVAIMAVVVGVECAWLAAVAYAVWRLVTLV